MSRIVLHDVVKQWASARAVDGVSIVAEQGELVALLGPSGCGKSTTLRLIAGLEQPSAGRIEIGGRDVTDLPAAQRNIAMVFQSYALFPHLSVAENIVFGLRVRRVPAAERATRLARVAELLGLESLLDRKPAQLSGGQRQRVALGRAVIAESPVCLMDEPLSNLDAQLRGQMRAEIRALQQRLGITMIYVTHDQTEAMTMADRIVLMRNGRVEQQGTPAQLYQRPETAFAATFIGAPAMNVFAAALLPPRAAARAAAGELVGVRPEHVALVPRSDGVPARVELVEYLGAETLVSCALGAARVVVRSAGAVSPPRGAEVGLAWDPQHEHRFAGDGGRRVDSAEQRNHPEEESVR